MIATMVTVEMEEEGEGGDADLRHSTLGSSMGFAVIDLTAPEIYSDSEEAS